MSAADADLPQGALPPGTRLHEFELRRVLGIGGFGIVYLGFDHMLEREVAIKEYMPSSLVGRTETMAVSLLSQSHAESFAMGLRSFVNEAKLLARFDDPSLVKVYRYWEANNTAYMAMRFYHGANLKAVRAQRGEAPDEAWLRSILDPLLGALERLHAEGIYHRDISPDNILVEPDGRPVLLDFGAARRVLSDRSQTLTAILKPAYAPIEQYAEVGAVKQGPWTDLYALGATMHFLLVGRPPPPATARAVQDEAVPLASLGLAGCSTRLLACIDWMLRPRPGERPQSVAAVRERLDGRGEVPAGAADPAWESTRIEPSREPTVLDLGQLTPPPKGVQAWRSDDTTQRVARPVAEEPTQRVARAAPEEPTQRLVRAAGDEQTRVVPPAAPAAAPSPAPGPAADAAAAPSASAAASPAAGPAPVAPAAAPDARAPARPAESAPAVAMHAEDARPHTPAAGGGLKWAVAGTAAVLVAFGAWNWSRPPATAPAAALPAPAASIVATPAPMAAPSAPMAAPSAPAVAATPAPGVSSTPAADVAQAPPAAPVAQAAKPVAAARPAAATRPGTAASAPAKVAEVAPRATTPDSSAPNPSALAARPGLVPGASLTQTPTGASLPSPAQSVQTQPPPPAAPAPAAANAPAPTAAPAPAAATAPAVRASAGAAPATAAATPAAAAPKPNAGEPEPMLRARRLGPAERCEGRVLVAYWACVESQCKNVPELANHPDCVKLRREQAPAR